MASLLMTSNSGATVSKSLSSTCYTSSSAGSGAEASISKTLATMLQTSKLSSPNSGVWNSIASSAMSQPSSLANSSVVVADLNSLTAMSTFFSLAISNSTSLEVVVTSVPMGSNATSRSSISSLPAPVVTQEPVAMSNSTSLRDSSPTNSPNLNATAGGPSLNLSSSPVASIPTATISSQIYSNHLTAPSTTTPPQSSSSEESRDSISSIEIFTSTNGNGDVAIITRTTVVPAGQADQTAAGSASKTNSAALGLQSNEAVMRSGIDVTFALILAVGGYMIMSLHLHSPRLTRY